MIYLITGGIDSGKTTKMIEIFNGLKSGDGFATKKIYIGNENIGQRIVRLSTQESEIFSMKLSHIPNLWDEKYRQGSYSFSKAGISFAENIADELSTKHVQPIFFDEIGPLEITNELGLYDAFKMLLENRMEMYITVREKCLNQLIGKFNLHEYSIINI